MKLVRRLEEINRDDVAIAGGKGANIGELLRAGLLVPPGFVLLTEAYHLFIESNKIQGEIEQLTSQITLTDPSSIEQASIAIRTLFDKGCMPGEIVSAVRTAYADMKGSALAVRSSATTEDLPLASYAGQQETYLNVQTEESLLAAIQRCWASLWTVRALDYRSRQRIAPDSAGIAIVIQEMVPASASGVLFTVNSVTGDPDELVINATWGLGEVLVGGQVTPDMIIADKQTGEVKRMEIGVKSVMTVPVEQGTILHDVDLSLLQKAALFPEQVMELTSLGRKIEAHFGAPQDIEWALANGRVFVLQSRPITTDIQRIPPGDDSWDREAEVPPQPFDLWTRTNVGENLPFPITPLTATNFPKMFALDESSTQQTAPSFQAARRFYGRLYLNEGAIVHELVEKYGIPASLIDKLWGSRARGNQQVRGTFHPLRLLRHLPLLLRQGFSASKQHGPRHTPRQFFAQIDQWVSQFLQQDFDGLDDHALWKQGLPVWRERGAYAFRTNLRISAPSGFLYAVLERLVQWWTKRKEVTQDLVAGLPGIYSAEVGPSLWRMAQALQELGLDRIVLDKRPATALLLLQKRSEAQPFLEHLARFLQRHGHRCPNELELLNPRWAEAPEQVIEMVANYLRAEESVNPLEVEKRRQQRRAEAVAAIERRLDPVRRAIFRAILKKSQQAITIRDNSRYFMAKFIFPMRALYARLGQRWAERGWLQQADDIFFLTVSEVEALVENGVSMSSPRAWQTHVANRRIAYEYWLTVIAPDALGPDGKPIIEGVEDMHMLQGIPASSGCARGRARIVQDVREAMQLTAGDILVTQATDPGWTPVFPLVSGIVLEIGGQLSHGAIVAREYAVPAVVNVQGAMSSIQDGQMITVDGTHGRVYVQSSPVPLRPPQLPEDSSLE